MVITLLLVQHVSSKCPTNSQKPGSPIKSLSLWQLMCQVTLEVCLTQNPPLIPSRFEKHKKNHASLCGISHTFSSMKILTILNT